MANVPTPPEPAWMRTFCPFLRCALSISACQAVKPTRGMDRHVSFFDRTEFRECTDSPVSQPRIDFVAGLESPHSRSDPDHDPGHVMAQNERQAIGENALELAVSDFRIQKVDTSGVNLDQDVIRSEER